MSKERPIPMKAHEVRGILEGRQYQFRRIMKPQPRRGLYGNRSPIPDDRATFVDDNLLGFPYSVWESPRNWVIPMTEACLYRLNEACPYGQPGMNLWVRETWACTPVWDWQAEGLDQPTNQVCGPKHTIYKADDDAVRVRRWKPPIHMPRWASRITLEVVSVRVERLQDISTYDSLAEGVGTDVVPMAQKMYADLWESINGPGSWDANPWVWVVEFKRIHP